MDVVEIAVGYLSGLHLLAPRRLEFPTLLASAIVVNLCNAAMCRVIARNNGHPPPLWTGLGLIFGIWAIAVLLLTPRREPESH